MVRNEGIICRYDLANYYLHFCRKKTKGTNFVPYEGTTNIKKLRKEHGGCKEGQKQIKRISARKETMSEDGKLLRIPQDPEGSRLSFMFLTFPIIKGDVL